MHDDKARLLADALQARLAEGEWLTFVDAWEIVGDMGGLADVPHDLATAVASVEAHPRASDGARAILRRWHQRWQRQQAAEWARARRPLTLRDHNCRLRLTVGTTFVVQLPSRRSSRLVWQAAECPPALLLAWDLHDGWQPPTTGCQVTALAVGHARLRLVELARGLAPAPSTPGRRLFVDVAVHPSGEPQLDS